LAVAYSDLKNAPRAMAEELEAIRLQPDSVAAHEGLANLLAAAGKNKEAIQQLTIVAQLQRDRPEVWNLLGKLYLREGKWDGAIKFFQAALELNPSYAEAKKNLTEAMEKQRQQAATQPTTATQPTSRPK
jgi:tetratricopeptide (TPR) repeat protein